eukprot:scaffold6562_cov120-Isochrysis_galbana.AAC.7
MTSLPWAISIKSETEFFACVSQERDARIPKLTLCFKMDCAAKTSATEPAPPSRSRQNGASGFSGCAVSTRWSMDASVLPK